MLPSYTIGVDYGTNSVRAVVVDCADGGVVGACVFDYPSGDHGVLLDPRNPHVARQNPVDCITGHGSFTWGSDPAHAIEHARVLEHLARVEWRVKALRPDAPRPEEYLVNKHYSRKHGPGAYYGQS